MQKQDKAALKNSLHVQIKSHPYLFLALLFLLICGIAAGAATIKPLLAFGGEEYLSECLLFPVQSSLLSTRSVIQLLLLDGSLLLLVFLAGIWTPGVILTTLAVLIKGFLLGVCVYSFIWRWGITGAVGALLAALLPGSLTLLVIFSFSQKSLLEWAARTKEFFHGKYPPISSDYLKNFLHSIKALCLSLLIEYFLSAAGIQAFKLLFDAFLAG